MARPRCRRTFTAASLELIHEHVAPGQRIELNQADAARFAANAVCVDRVVVMSSGSDALRRSLEDRGYKVAKTIMASVDRRSSILEAGRKRREPHDHSGRP